MVGHYKILLLKVAKKDKEKIKAVPALRKNVEQLLQILAFNPFQNPPPYEKLVGNLSGYYSRRINKQHRLVYRVLQEDKTVIIASMWSHYE